MNERIINGDADILLVWDGAIYRPIACITSSGMDESMSFIERLTKCSEGAVEKSPGAYSASINVEGIIFDTTTAGGDTSKASYDWLQRKMRGKVQMIVKTTTGDAPAEYSYVFLENLSRTSPAGEDITFSATLQISGVPVAIDPALGNPGIPTLTPSVSGGVLAAGAKFYKITAFKGAFQSLASPEATVSTTGSTSSIALSWTAVTGATSYRIYRGTTTNGQNIYFTSAGATFTDIGGTGTVGTPPTA